MRDVMSVPSMGWARIRFIANNPGVWQFHCHISWHVAAGMVMEFIESPKALAAGVYADPIRPFQWEPIPPSHKAACNKPTKRIIKLGGYFNVFDPKNASYFNREQAQCLTAFLMAVQEINNNATLLPNYEIQVAIRSGENTFAGAIKSAEDFTSGTSLSAVTFPATTSAMTYLSPVGVDLLIGAGTDGNYYFIFSCNISYKYK